MGFLKAIISGGKILTNIISTILADDVSGFNNKVRTENSLDQLVPPATDLNVNGKKLTNVANPTIGTDAANKAYVDNLIHGVNWKKPCRLATTANITLSGLQVIDGIMTNSGDRVLVKDQTTPSQNGIRIASSGTWARADDANVWEELISASVIIEEGTTNADDGWVCKANQGGTLESSAVEWIQFIGNVTSLPDYDVSDTFTVNMSLTGDLFSADVNYQSTDTVTLDEDTAGLKADVNNNSIDTAHLKDGAVTTAKILDGAVTSPKIAASSVTSLKIAAGAVGYRELDVQIASGSEDRLQINPPAPGVDNTLYLVFNDWIRRQTLSVGMSAGAVKTFRIPESGFLAKGFYQVYCQGTIAAQQTGMPPRVVRHTTAPTLTVNGITVDRGATHADNPSAVHIFVNTSLGGSCLVDMTDPVEANRFFNVVFNLAVSDINGTANMASVDGFCHCVRLPNPQSIPITGA